MGLKVLASLLAVLGCASASLAQPPEAVVQSGGADALRVFLDCDNCDFDYLRTEIPFVNYVRDRMDAQVHVLMTEQDAGGGGNAVTLDFIGLEALAGIDNRLVYYTQQDQTDDDERRVLAQRLRLGLVHYAAETTLADDLDVMYAAAEVGSQVGAQPAEDPWNFWFFRADFDTELNKEERETTKQFGGAFLANRTTDAWKIDLGLNIEYEEESFELADAETFSNISRDNAIDVRVVKSLGDHIGLGLGGSAVTSTFRNQQLALRVAPAIEYNFYSYAESTRRQFTVSYSVGVNRFDYEQLTIFDRASELLTSHSVIVVLDVNQPWGTSELAFETSQFLDSPSNYRSVFSGEIGIRLFRGFSLELEGEASLIRDQLFLPREDATNEEILIRRRQLATDYEAQFQIGITYSFGSIYNNVVNSRFAGSSGGFIRSY